MTNGIAIVLGGLIVAAVALNFALGWEAHIFLGRKFADMLEWLAFWR